MALRDRGLAELSTRHVLLLAAVFVALATVHLWPMPSDPVHLTRLDNDDTAFNTWVVAWVQHQLLRDPLDLFDAPIFYPARRTLAFSEHMLIQSVMGLPLHLASLSPVTIYNVLVWLGHALSGLAMALLMRTWTGSTVAAIVSGSLYAFNAHLLTRYSHLQALHMQFLPVVLYAFDRVLREPRPRYAVMLVVAFVLQALCSNYTMVMLAAALIVAFAVRNEAWRGGLRLWGTLAIAGAAAGVLLAPFLYPYYQVRQEHGLVRTVDDLGIYSAGLYDYLVTAARVHYPTWSHHFYQGRTALFPGITGLGLAFAAVILGAAWQDPRARMALAFGVMGFALSFGSGLPGYAWMQEHVALLQGIRAAARWGLFFLISVAILAGFAVARLQQRWHDRWWWPAAATAMILLVTLEALRAPLPMERYSGIPAVHDRLADIDINAMVVFPFYGGNQFNLNADYLLHQTRHWKPMLNAYSSFAPPIFYDLEKRLQSFPDANALATMREFGFTHVLLHREPLARSYGHAAVDQLRMHPQLQFVFESDGVILYRVP